MTSDQSGTPEDARHARRQLRERGHRISGGPSILEAAIDMARGNDDTFFTLHIADGTKISVQITGIAVNPKGIDIWDVRGIVTSGYYWGPLGGMNFEAVYAPRTRSGNFKVLIP